MNIQRAAPANELLAKLIFLMLPTAVVAYLLINHLIVVESVIGNDAWKQCLYFSVAMGASALFYALRFRFLPTFLLLVGGFFLFAKGIYSYANGEFSAIYLRRAFLVFAWLFSLGWLCGWGFLRKRYWSIGAAAFFLVANIFLISKEQIDTESKLYWAYVPAIAYAVYIIFAAEQIYSYQDKAKRFWWYMSSRLGGFLVVAGLMLWGIIWLNRGRIKDTVANYGGGGKGGNSAMMKRDSNGNGHVLVDSMQLKGQLGRSNELLFCAHIDNYFPGTDIPNPLYLTSFYYTKFDNSTETFERDKNLPKNDLFLPDPSSLSLFQTKEDRSVIDASGTEKNGKEVEIQVYSRGLSPGTYLAPHTGFFVQPITVEREFRDSFKTAFRAKSWVSELNSAYFVYNINKPVVRKFQEQRFQVLRKVAGYAGEPADFMKYYTSIPADAKYQSIYELAKKVTAAAKTPVDKVLALRDYFLSKNAAGQPLFSYTDNPGVPDIPNASKLTYFLLQNRKGYCAYYAGATLFMLRSLGIPSRIAVGFLTEDRSGGKNKGWYWFYEKQAHAWVQVYFPGYGWLDFDTTVGNGEAHEAPQTDPTPPTQPPHAWLAADGLIVSNDTSTKKMVMSIRHFVFHDKEYKLAKPVEAVMDMKIAAVRRDSVAVPLSTIIIGEQATAVSYADAFKNMEARTGESGEALLKRFPIPEPIDELYLKRIEQKEKKEQPKAEPATKAFSWSRAIWVTLVILASLILLFFLMPVLIFEYLKFRADRAKDVKSKSYWSYRAAMFYLHQLGYARGSRTPLQYARDLIDPQLDTALTPFMYAYLKQKFAQQTLNAREEGLVNGFLRSFRAAIKRRIGVGTRLGKFLNPLRAISFFGLPDEEEEAK